MQGGTKNQGNSSWKGWLVLIVGLVMAARVGVNVVRLYRLGSQVEEVETQLASEKLRNASLKQKLEEAQTDEFMEKEVRNLGYAREGETLIIIPEEILPRYGTGATESGEVVAKWRQWWNLYFGS